MDPISSVPAANLTADQQATLKKLHESAQQLEGVFVEMLFKQMRSTQAQKTIFGKVSETEKTFTEMLDQKRADSLSKTGALGIARVLEEQLKATVLGFTAPPATKPVAPAAAVAPAPATGAPEGKP